MIVLCLPPTDVGAVDTAVEIEMGSNPPQSSMSLFPAAMALASDALARFTLVATAGGALESYLSLFDILC